MPTATITVVAGPTIADPAVPGPTMRGVAWAGPSAPDPPTGPGPVAGPPVGVLWLLAALLVTAMLANTVADAQRTGRPRALVAGLRRCHRPDGAATFDRARPGSDPTDPDVTHGES